MPTGLGIKRDKRGMDRRKKEYVESSDDILKVLLTNGQNIFSFLFVIE